MAAPVVEEIPSLEPLVHRFASASARKIRGHISIELPLIAIPRGQTFNSLAAIEHVKLRHGQRGKAIHDGGITNHDRIGN